MNNHSMSNLSLDYYERRASTYAQQTLTVNMGTLIREFLALLPPAGHILDMGCGSGRDAVAFLQKGYDITALDGSAALCRIAKEQLNKAWHSMPQSNKPTYRVIHKNFLDIDWQQKFDGIWACASLLHCNEESLPIVLDKISHALKPGGVLYVSFKYGQHFRMDGEREFLDLDEARFEHFFASASSLHLKRLWHSQDQRIEDPTIWLNALLVKQLI